MPVCNSCRLGLETKLKSGPARQRIKDLVGEATGWLARVVRTMVNTNNWVQTVWPFCPDGTSYTLMLNSEY